MEIYNLSHIVEKIISVKLPFTDLNVEVKLTPTVNTIFSITSLPLGESGYLHPKLVLGSGFYFMGEPLTENWGIRGKSCRFVSRSFSYSNPYPDLSFMFAETEKWFNNEIDKLINVLTERHIFGLKSEATLCMT